MDFPLLHERASQVEPSLELTPSQEKALTAVDRYAAASIGERDNFAEHARRTADIVHVFAGNDLPSKAIDAAYLHDVYDRATGEDTHNMLQASAQLAEYFANSDISEKEAEYVMSLINDMTIIEDTATLYREMDETVHQLRDDDPELWTREAPAIPLDDMFQVSKNVNIESVLIKSCEILDHLHHPAHENLSAAHDIYEAESFYAPLCEVLGYDGLAMELRSHAKQNRLFYQGKGDLVVNVARFCYDMRRLGPQSVLNKFANEEDFSVSNVVNQPRYIDKYSDTSYETVELGEFALDMDGQLMTGNWRIKSVGSLAGKLLRSDRSGEAPMDVMGMTVISEDVDRVAQDFSTMSRHVMKSDALHPQKAPSKQHAFVVQGDRAYIDRICQELGEVFVEQNVDIIENADGYRVSKFTCLSEDSMPIEMQFVTKADRKAGRVGKWAHIFHKLKECGVTYTEEQKVVYASWLEQIYERKCHMNEHGAEPVVNPQSLVQGRRAMRNLRAMQAIRTSS